MELSLENRVENSVRNVSIGLIAQCVQLLSTLVCRVILVRCLAQEYIGINGLFTSVMGVLSIAELGIGSAISYELYQALAKKDTKEQASLMAIYKKLYMIIGAVICAIGLVVMPIVNSIVIKDSPEIGNTYLLYIVYLLGEVISYLFMYRETIIYAAQRSHILTVWDVIFGVIRNAVQCFVLIYTHSFFLYVLLQVTFRMFYNFAATITANRMFPEALKAKNTEPVSKERRQQIFKNIRYIFTEKAATSLLNCTDNLVTGAICGLAVTGVNSNYSMIVITMSTFTAKVQNALTAGVGNISAVETKEKQRDSLYEICMIYFWIYACCSICFAFLVREVSHIVFGQGYVQSFMIGVVTSVNFLQSGMLIGISTFRNTQGLFKYGKYAMLWTGVINVILSVILGYKFGLLGVLIGTFISRLITVDWYYPYVTFKYGFGTSVWPYYIYTLKLWLEVAVMYFITWKICDLISYEGLEGFLIKFIFCLIISNGLIIIFNFGNKEFKSVISKLKRTIIKRKI